MKIQKVCLLTNYNLYESKRYFCQKLCEAFERKGVESLLVDAEESAVGADTIAAIQAFSPNFTFSFNSFLPLKDRTYLWDFLQIPHVSALVDPALYAINFSESPWSILSTVDKFDLEALRSTGFQRTFLFPHAVERELGSDQDQEKEFEVVFFGSCYDYESLRVSWRQQNTSGLNKVLDDAIDLVFSHATLSLNEALVQAWNSSNLDPSGVDFMSLFYYLDNYTRGRDRVELIKAIKGASVHVFGELSQDNAVGFLGWKQYLAGCKNVVLHDSVPYKDSLDYLKRSKICLNSMPFFKNGSHERVLTGLACGAVPITTENLFFREFFGDGREVVYYRMDHKESIDERIRGLLDNEEQRREMACRGRNIVMESFTWDNRVGQLLQTLPGFFDQMCATHD